MLLDEIVKWANHNENIIALIQTGSYARGLEDEFSDYDIEIIAKNPKELIESNEWFKQFGTVVVYEAFDEGQEYPTRLVIYNNGLKVDFTLAGSKRIQTLTNSLDSLYNRGYKVLIDKSGITRDLPQVTGLSPIVKMPTEKEYFFVVSEFWFEAYHIPKYLIRNDLWVVKFRDWTMKTMLLQMLEWYAISKNPKADTWHIGSKMEEWLDPKIWQELNTIFAHFGKKDSWNALLASVELFRKISKDVASKLNYKYPEEIDKCISEYIQSYKSRF